MQSRYNIPKITLRKMESVKKKTYLLNHLENRYFKFIRSSNVLKGLKC